MHCALVPVLAYRGRAGLGGAPAPCPASVAILARPHLPGRTPLRAVIPACGSTLQLFSWLQSTGAIEL
eukprot:8758182-Lingulodinium_polyedra.AAC.1